MSTPKNEALTIVPAANGFIAHTQSARRGDALGGEYVFQTMEELCTFLRKVYPHRSAAVLIDPTTNVISY